MHQAIQSGVFQFLHSNILETAAFKDEPLDLKELCAQKVNALLLEFLETETEER